MIIGNSELDVSIDFNVTPYSEENTVWETKGNNIGFIKFKKVNGEYEVERISEIPENYDKFVETISSTGNTYNVEMQVQVKDENLGKKVSQAQADKIGENVYYSVYTSQIEKALDGSNATYYCKEGDIVSVSVKNTNQTISQQLKNFFYTVTGNDSYTIAAEHAGIVTANGN